MHPASAAKLSNPGVSQCNLSNKGCMRPFWHLGLTRVSSNLETSQPPHEVMYLPARQFPVPGSTIKSLLGPVAHPLLLCLCGLWFCSLWFLAECCSPQKCWALTYPVSFLFWLWVTYKQCGEAFQTIWSYVAKSYHLKACSWILDSFFGCFTGMSSHKAGVSAAREFLSPSK